MTLYGLIILTGAGHKLVIEFHAHREKLLQERLTVKSQDGSDNYREIHLHARVLGKYWDPGPKVLKVLFYAQVSGGSRGEWRPEFA